MKYDLNSVMSQFSVYGEYLIGVPYGTGHINDTFQVTFDQGGTIVHYILQRVNTNVFRKPEELMENISIENPIDTRILSITVTYPDPQLAAQIANEIAYQAVEYLPDIMESPAPNIYEEATVPTQKSSPSYKINTVVGGFLFALIYCSILMGKYFIKDTFETPEDVTRFFGIQPLAVVPERNMGLNKSKHGNRSLQKKVTAGSV